MAKQFNKKRSEKHHPILWFLFAIVVPLIVAVVLVVIILSVAGVNVIDWAKNTRSNMPVVSNFVKTDEEKEMEEASKQQEEMIENQVMEIEQLNEEIDHLQSTNETLEQEIVKLENQLNSE